MSEVIFAALIALFGVVCYLFGRRSLRPALRDERVKVQMLTQDLHMMRANWEQLNELRQLVIDRDLLPIDELKKYL